jgi:hypothetical protein
MKFQFFGSKSSIDYDVMIFIKSIPSSIEECKELCEYYNKEINYIILNNNLPTKKVNSNLAVLDNGIIKNIHKGMVCECNNSLYHTYDNFYQLYTNSIERLMTRDIDLKILRCFRIILTFLSRTLYREKDKKSLRDNLLEKINVLRTIDFNNLDFGNRNGEPIDIWKSISFQIGQTLLLTKGIELYSKEEICSYIPELNGFIMRDEKLYNFSSLISNLEELSKYVLDNKKYLLEQNEKTFLTQKI